jgi:4-hydroxybenzoate polyprenyltransferase
MPTGEGSLGVQPELQEELHSNARSLGERAVRRATQEILAVAPARVRSVSCALLEMRPQQWAKSLLVFVPIVAAHRFYEGDLWRSLFLAFLVFNAGSSGQYILKDILDLASDRAHPSKGKRPLAGGAMTVRSGIVLALALVATSLCVSYVFLPRPFTAILVLYHAMGSLYSAYLRKIAWVDVVVLVAMYILRLFGGAAVANIVISPWLLAFSVAFFFSLAMLKRTSEIACQVQHSWPEARPAYTRGTRLSLLVSGMTSGGAALLILVFYIRSEHVLLAYRTPVHLWLLCPLLAFWLGRFWMLADRGRVGVDPVSFMLRDAVSYAVLLCSVLSFWAAL